jgi:hypothetical protein
MLSTISAAESQVILSKIWIPEMSMIGKGFQVVRFQLPSLFAIDHLFAIPSGELNSASILLLLSFVFFFRCSLYKYEFFEISYCMKEKKRDDIHY